MRSRVRRGRTVVLAASLLAVGLSACDKLAKLAQERQKTTPSAAPIAAAAPAAEKGAGDSDIATLIAQGHPDEALAKLAAVPASADTLYLQGLAWAKKAETAPLPTPPPPPSPAVRGAPPPVAPEFKNEELTAAEYFEKALQQSADHSGASLALAQLLAPHAARRYEAEQAAAKGRRPQPGRKGAPPPQPVGPAAEGPDYSVARVAQLYRAALQAETTKTEAVEDFVKFCRRVGLIDEADGAMKELVRRDKEKPEPLVRYGDFLNDVKKDPQAAMEQYNQALMWKPDDPTAKSRIADIYINMGIDNYSKLQYAAAEARFKDASRYVTDPHSPQALKIQDYMGKLGAIRKLPRP